MSLLFNSTSVDEIKYNGTHLEKVVFNGVTVWDGFYSWVPCPYYWMDPSLNNHVNYTRQNLRGDGFICFSKLVAHEIGVFKVAEDLTITRSHVIHRDSDIKPAQFADCGAGCSSRMEYIGALSSLPNGGLTLRTYIENSGSYRKAYSTNLPYSGNARSVMEMGGNGNVVLISTEEDHTYRLRIYEKSSGDSWLNTFTYGAPFTRVLCISQSGNMVAAVSQMDGGIPIVMVFEKGPSSWNFIHSIGWQSGRIGSMSLSHHGSVLVITSRGTQTGVFKRSGNSFNWVGNLTPPEGSTSSFGTSVEVSGNGEFIMATDNGARTSKGNGVAYAYKYDEGNLRYLTGIESPSGKALGDISLNHPGDRLITNSEKIVYAMGKKR